MIPRRLAYRIWAACLGSRSRRLRSLADDAHPDRRRGRRGDPAKGRARAETAARLLADADTLAGWIAGGGPPGGDLDPAVVGLVAAYLHGHAESGSVLLCRGAARGRTDAPRPTETIAFARWAMDAC